MPLLYRILMRLAALVLVLTFAICGIGIAAVGGADFSHPNWLAVLSILFGPAALIAGVAWVVKPPAQ